MIQCFNTIDLDENLAWLTQKTEEPKCNRGNYYFSLPVYKLADLAIFLAIFNFML